MHIDVYADYLRTIHPQTPSTALRALFTRDGGKSTAIDSRYTVAYGPHDVMLNIDGIIIYTKTMITYVTRILPVKSTYSRGTQVEVDWRLRHARRGRMPCIWEQK